MMTAPTETGTGSGGVGSEGPILVPVDFSDGARVALDWAREVAAHTNLPLIALHVVHDPEEDPGIYREGDNDIVLRPLVDRAEEMLHAFLAEEKVTAETRIVDGIPVTRILEVADEVGASQIIMGSLGRTGLERLLLGSKAEQVVRLARVPVTIVKPPKKTEGGET